eukprot:jgi/Psemu1/215686/e_gw1.756.26.1
MPRDDDDGTNANKDPHSFRLPTQRRNGAVGSALLSSGDVSSSSEEAASVNEQETIIAEAFAHDGFFVLRELFDAKTLLPFRGFADAYFLQCFRDLHECGHVPVPSYRHRREEDAEVDVDDTETNAPQYTLQKGVPNGFREIVMRSPGRYELSLHHHRELWDAHRLDKTLAAVIQPLSSLLPRLVGPTCTVYDDLKLCHLSLLIATPGSSDQSWHADGGHLSLSEHLPCHCFNVFVPLQDTSHELGPTEVRPSSHFLTRNLGPMMLAARCRKTLRAPVWPELAVGDAIVLDYRVLHRGRANRSGGSSSGSSITLPATNRNYLVLSYSEPWFDDVLNFPKRSLYESSPKAIA